MAHDEHHTKDALQHVHSENELFGPPKARFQPPSPRLRSLAAAKELVQRSQQSHNGPLITFHAPRFVISEEQKRAAAALEAWRDRLLALGVTGFHFGLDTLPQYIKAKIFNYAIRESKRSIGIEIRVCFAMGHNHPALYWTLSSKTLPPSWITVTNLMETSSTLRKDVLAFIIPNCDVALTSCAEWKTCICDGLHRFRQLNFEIEFVRTLILPDYIWREASSEMFCGRPSTSMALLKWISEWQIAKIILIPDTSVDSDNLKFPSRFEKAIAQQMPGAGKVIYWDPQATSDAQWALWWEDDFHAPGSLLQRFTSYRWPKWVPESL